MDSEALSASARALGTLIESPAFAIMACLVLGALAMGGRLSAGGAKLLFACAWAAGLWAFDPLQIVQFLWVAGFFTGLVLLLMFWSHPEIAPKNWGKLIPKGRGKPRETILSKTCLNRNVRIGSSGTVFVHTGPEGSQFIRFSEDSGLTIERIKGRLKVSMRILDQFGNLVAELVRNNWQVAQTPVVFDRNYSKNALEIRNGSGRIVLQVKLHEDELQLQIEWWANGRCFKWMADPRGPGAIMSMVVPGPNFAEDLAADPIKAMFKYPSSRYLGKLANTD